MAGRGIQTKARTSATLGSDDPRHRRNAQAELATGQTYGEPLGVDGSGRLTVSLDSTYFRVAGGKLTIDLVRLKKALDAMEG